MPSPLSIILAPPCPLGHGPMPLINTAPSPMFNGRPTEEFKCRLCSCQIFRPVPDDEL